MYRVIIWFACVLALANFLLIQTQGAAFVSMAIVLAAVVYGIYKSPKEKRLPIVLFMIVAIPIFILLGNYLE